jgi:hypothetical protein
MAVQCFSRAYPPFPVKMLDGQKRREFAVGNGGARWSFATLAAREYLHWLHVRVRPASIFATQFSP